MPYICLAEIDKLKKSQAKSVVATVKEIPRPRSMKKVKLQDVMGLNDNKKLYSECRVRFVSVFTRNHLNLMFCIPEHCSRCCGKCSFTT